MFSFCKTELFLFFFFPSSVIKQLTSSVQAHLQVAGGCWYVLAIQRVVMCLQKQCNMSLKCNFSISCSKVISYQFLSPAESSGNLPGGNWSSPCFDDDGPFKYGIYGDALPVISSESLSVRVLYPIFWGLLNLRYSFNMNFLTKWK